MTQISKNKSAEIVGNEPIIRDNPNIPPIPIILGLEASGEHASAAVVQGDVVLGEARLDQRHGHASGFVSLAQGAVRDAGLSFQEIGAIAAGVGPGSFTGLRVCLSAAKGFALAGGIQGIGVHGLRARAFAAQSHKGYDDAGLIIACADTRRGALFYQSYDRDLVAQDEIAEIALADMAELAGRGFVALPPHLPADLPESGEMPVIEMPVIEMSARHIGLLAARDLAQNSQDADKEETLSGLDPLYVAAPKLGPAKAS